MSRKKVPPRARRGAGEDARDTRREPEAGDFSDPRVRWPEKEWQRTEQPRGEWPPSRATGQPSAGHPSRRPRDEAPPDLSGFGDGSAAGSSTGRDTRPDGEIHAEIRAELDADEQCEATGIAVEVRDGVVVLEGKVPTRPMKRRAAEIANTASDVRTVDNRLQVDCS